MNIMAKEHTDYDELAFEIECPTCEEHTTFVYRGKQTFPEQVAAQLELPSVIHLWSCSNCYSTISHVDLGIDL